MQNIHKILVVAVFLLVTTMQSVCMAEMKRVNLSWNAPASGSTVEGYYLYYGQTDDVNSMTRVGPIYGTNHILELDDAGKVQYYFYVSAFNSAGEGPKSAVKSVGIDLSVN